MKKIIFLLPVLLVLVACQQDISYKKNSSQMNNSQYSKENTLQNSTLIQKPADIIETSNKLPPTIETIEVVTTQEKTSPVKPKQDEPTDEDLIYTSINQEESPSTSEFTKNAAPLKSDKPTENVTEELDIDLNAVLEEMKKKDEAIKAETEEVQEIISDEEIEEEVINEEDIMIFDHCGELEEFSNYVWYWEFLTEIHNQKKFNPTDPIMESENTSESYKNKRISAGDITQICASHDSGVVLTLLSGDNIGNGFHLFRFHRETMILEEASRKESHWTLTPGSFGKRTGLNIELPGERIINRCTERGTFQYNYVDNTIRQAKKCSHCPGDTESICLNYED